MTPINDNATGEAHQHPEPQPDVKRPFTNNSPVGATIRSLYSSMVFENIYRCSLMAAVTHNCGTERCETRVSK